MKKLTLLFVIFHTMLMANGRYVNGMGIEKDQFQVPNSISAIQDTAKIEYSKLIFGQFIEHFHTQVYGGIYDPGSKLSDKDGFRTDVIEALKEIKMPIIRWPGGCFASTYHWMGGIGPERVPIYDKTWGVEDPNTFGTDEFIKWCKKIGTEPYICTNAGTGTPEEMTDWVEYCNLDIGKYAHMRKMNGHQEPYHVKYWSIGNENYGDWELGARTVEEWGHMVKESAKLMLSVSHDIKLFAAATPHKDWSLPLLAAAGYYLDYISIHGYWDQCSHNNNVSSYLDCMFRTEGPENEIKKAIDILEESGFRGKIKIAFDEWNLRGWHHPWHGDFHRGFNLEARKKNDINSTYTMADALFSACFLNACLRNASDVEIACFSPIVNTRGAIYTHADGILKRTTFYTLKMYTNWLEKLVVPIESKSERLISGDKSTPVLDMILTCNKKGNRYVCAIVNKDPEHERVLYIDFKSIGIAMPKELKGKVLMGSSPDDYNDIGAENRVIPQDTRFLVRNSEVTIPPHALVFLIIE